MEEGHIIVQKSKFKNNMKIVLIGSPGAGKTTLLKKLQQKNVNVFHADSYVNQIYKKGNIGYDVIKKEFGDEFVNDLKVDKLKLGNFLSKNPNLIEKLNQIIFPLIKNYLKGKDNFVAELPIINNSNIKFDYDFVVLVCADENVIYDRLSKNKKIEREFVKNMVKNWDNNKHEFDLVVDTSSGINDIDIKKIVEKLNH